MRASHQLELVGGEPRRARRRRLTFEQNERIAAAMVALLRGEITRARFEVIRAEVESGSRSA